MNGATVQDKMYYGYGKVAEKIGTSFDLYRPAGPLDVMDSGNLIQEGFMVSLLQDGKFSKPNKYGNAVWQGIFDGRETQKFDYLTNGDVTYFINAMPQVLPITLVECNTVVSVSRAAAPTTNKGKVAYGANLASTETVLMSNCPVSQLIGTKWERNLTGLPMDTRLPYWIYLIPDLGVEIKISDIITEANGRRAVVATPELTEFGWRISASVSVA